MREILFRGKRVEEPIKIPHYAPDGWVYGDLITCDDGHFILPHDISGEMYIDRPYKFRANDVEARVMLAKVGENTTGQYTELTDKNGTKIFEGDFIKAKHNTNLYNVYWNEGRFYLEDVWGNLIKPTQTAINHFECEIVGNIYDNPELIGGAK